MKRLTLIVATLPLLAAGCVVSQQSGETIIEPAPMFAKPQWEAMRSSDGCVLRAGDIDVTIPKDKKQAEQVRLTRRLEPGMRYSISVRSHRYETRDGTFATPLSQQIIDDLIKGNTAYTVVINRLGPRNHVRRFPNVIPLAGFTKLYNSCRK